MMGRIWELVIPDASASSHLVVLRLGPVRVAVPIHRSGGIFQGTRTHGSRDLVTCLLFNSCLRGGPMPAGAKRSRSSTLIMRRLSSRLSLVLVSRRKVVQRKNLHPLPVMTCRLGTVPIRRLSRIRNVSDSRRAATWLQSGALDYLQRSTQFV